MKNKIVNIYPLAFLTCFAFSTSAYSDGDVVDPFDLRVKSHPPG